MELLAGRIPASWMVMLVDGAVKGFLVLAIAAIVATMLRYRSSAVRHLVWTLGVLAMLAMPLVSWLVPSVRVPVPLEWAPAVAPMATVHERGHATTVIEVAPIVTSIEVGPSTHGISKGHGGRAIAGPRSVHVRGNVRAIVTPPTPAKSRTVVITPTPSRSPALSIARTGYPPPGGFRADLSASATSWSAWILGVWLTGVLTVLSWMVFQQVRLEIVRRRAQRIVGGRCARMVDDIAWELGIDGEVLLLAGDDDAMPMTWGVFRPVLLLPGTAFVWSRDRLAMVLRHELAHVARRDAASQWIAELACALHWYNPLVWIAAARMRVEREHACDDLVLESGPRASEYATELLDIARTLMARRGLHRAAIAMARRSQLKQRLAAVLDEGRPRSRPTGGVFAVALLSAAGIVLPLAALQPTPTPWRSGLPVPFAAPTADARPMTIDVAPIVVAVPLNVRVTQAAVCRRSENGNTSINRNDENWRMHWEGRDCHVDIRIDGEFEHDVMFTAITSIAPGGVIQIEEHAGNRDRRLVIRPSDGGLEMAWQLDGRDAPFDAAAREWYGQMLQEIARTTGIGADQRAAAILDRDGPAGVLQEIDQLRSDRVRARYYRALLLSDRIETDARINAVERAAVDINSDRELASLLGELTDRVATSSELRTAVLQSTATIDSDREKVRVYTQMMESSTLSGEQKATVIASAGTVHSDRERNRLLSSVASQTLDSSELHASYIDAARTMSSDREKRQALSRILQAGSLNTEQLAALFDAARTMQSDRELATLLLDALETQDMNGPARDAFIRAMDSIQSEREHGRVASALTREGR
jgi:beta-lactamase regulating signal transducer with metallopeptidase domain